MGISKRELIRKVLRVYLATRQWQPLQRSASLRAKEKGIASEADVENLIDKLR